MSETAARNLANPFTEDAEAAELLNSFDDEPAPRSPKVVEKAIKAADEIADKKQFNRRAKPKKQRMRRSSSFLTGRSEQIAIRGREEDRTRLDAHCERQDWVKGQLLQYALDALEKELANPESDFCETRNFEGVE